jgi:hypothetical protein
MSPISDGAASGMSRGVLVTSPMNESSMFRVTDDLVRCKFTISLYDEPIDNGLVRYSARTTVMEAHLLIDSGAEYELKLPGRKVAQLGLKELPTTYRTRGSTPGHGTTVKFFPPVMVSATFQRKDPKDQVIEEEVTGLLYVSADRSNYREAKAIQDAKDFASQNEREHAEISPWIGNAPPTPANSTPAKPATPPPTIHHQVYKL